ncbi:hypothetical protein T265_05926 [Opisthorchis viverrini]|uniref:Uncharacterized protein n=1 Tax=Opisthorchis viverrini TaxID=6198 RepID=A0A074ZI16_OPIVI|nr:hypothetical protein T265_05926 [Opisthorchis viverrini]KER26948.1 hypothetical protein T265_05926 [Opisthorchis viverrini]
MCRHLGLVVVSQQLSIKLWLCGSEASVLNTDVMLSMMMIMLRQPGSIPVLVLPSGSMATRHRRLGLRSQPPIYPHLPNFTLTLTTMDFSPLSIVQLSEPSFPVKHCSSYCAHANNTVVRKNGNADLGRVE